MGYSLIQLQMQIKVPINIVVTGIPISALNLLFMAITIPTAITLKITKLVFLNVRVIFIQLK